MRAFPRLAWRLLALLLVLGAIATTVYRFAPSRLPGSFTTRASELLADFIELPVRIGSIDLTWGITGPMAEVRGVAVLNAEGDREIVRFQRGLFELSFTRSLLALGAVIESVSVSGFALHVLIEPDGRLAMWPEGEASPAVARTGDEMLAWASRVPDLSLDDGKVVVEGLLGRAAPLRVSDFALALRNEGAEHELVVSGDAPGLGSNLRLVVRGLLGEESNQDSEASIYVEGRQLDLASLSRWFTEGQSTLGVADAQAWFRWSGGRIQEAWLEAEAFGLRSPTSSDGAMIEHVEAKAHAVRDGSDWAISTPALTLGWAERTDVAVGPVSARLGDGANFAALIERIPVDALLAAAAAYDRVPSEIRADLVAAEPGGEMTDVRLAWSLDSPATFRGSGDFAGLEMSAAGPLPALARLDGRVFLVPGEILLDVDSRDATADLPRIFREALEFQRISGRVAVRWGQGSWEVEAPDVAVANQHFAARGRLLISKELDDSKPFLDVQAYVENADASHTSRYLPVGIMKPRLTRWLDRAIVGGRVPRAGILLRGPASAFPFRNAEGVFRVLFPVEDAHLDYRAGWPPLYAADAVVAFRDQAFDAHGTRGLLLGMPAGPATARIDDLQRGSLQLEMSAEAEAGDFLRFVAATPLQDRLGAALAPLAFEGRNTLDLDLEVPLRGGGPVRVEGGVGFDGGRISLPDWNLAIDDVRGVAGFTEDGVRIRDLSGRSFDAELTIDALREPEALRVSARGEIDASKLLEVAKLPPEVGMEGRSRWAMDLAIPTGASGFQLKLSSDLEGTAIRLPPPLEKAPDTARPLVLTLDVEPALSSTARFQYGEQLDGLVEFDKLPTAPALKRASIQLGIGEVEPLPDTGMAVRGALDELHLEPWLALFDAERSSYAMPPLQDANVRVGILRSDIGQLQDVHVRYAPRDWRVESAGGVASGEIFSEGSDGRITARLRHLDLELPAGGGREWPHPASIPPLDISVADFSFDGKALGQFVVETVSTPEGLGLAAVSLNGPDVDFAASGTWVRTERDAATLAGTLKSPDLGRLTRTLGFDLAMEEASADIEFDLNWPGPLLKPDLSGLDGSLGFVVGQGRLSDLNPGVGRVLGLVNLRSLGRRLSLDFSDVLDEGFAFDGMEANFAVESGDAYTEDFLIKAPAARIDVQGRVGLATRDYDQLITVTPDVSGAIPVAAAIAAGPVVGAAVLLAEQIVGSSFDRGSSVQYEVSGSWDDPQIERLSPEPVETQRTPEELISR